MEKRSTDVNMDVSACLYSDSLTSSPVGVVEQVKPLQSPQLFEPRVVESCQLVVREIQLLQAPQRVER